MNTTAATMSTSPLPVLSATMRAVVHPHYGEPDSLVLEAVCRPMPGVDDVLVRVMAAGATIGDHHIITGRPYLVRLSPFGGLPRPRHRVPGQTFSGRVEAVGAGVTRFKPGDAVFGQAPTGAYAELLVIPAAQVVPMPTNLSFEGAAAAAWGVHALQGLRDAGGLVAGQRVLVNGASGGVGTWAVQIAKALGAHVTAVCSTRNVEWVRGLGADEVIDYTRADFATGGARFDLMMDLVGDRPLAECRRVLVPTGVYVACSGEGGDWAGPLPRVLGGLLTSLFTPQRFRMLVGTPNPEDLAVISALIESGQARPIVERSFPLDEVGAALTHVGAGHAQGQTVIRIGAEA